jgi:hypothetical protein
VSDARLPAHVEASSILRRLESSGDFGTVLRKGDPDRGSLLLIITSRGTQVAILERVLDPSGNYAWQSTARDSQNADVPTFLAKRARFDEDFWALELDIADPERFIAETIASG